MNRWMALSLISVAVFFTLSMWFSASVIVDQLQVIWNLSAGLTAWVTSSVQVGFIAGALVSACFGLADRVNARKLFAFCAVSGAVINVCLIFVDQAWIAIFLRGLTGVTLAGVYPTAVKLLAQWFPKQRGLAMGIVIAALTLGSALPHLVSALSVNLHWEFVFIASSLLAVIAAAIMRWLLIDQSREAVQTSFSLKMLSQVIHNKPVMLANFGYFGHMWELYAMWAWFPSFLVFGLAVYHPEADSNLAAVLSFITIGGAGALGCIIGGLAADRLGKSNLTIVAMGVSAACSLTIGLALYHSFWLFLAISVIWSAAVIADSAQFSAIVTEWSEYEYVGTALTFQMSIGYLVTIGSINVIPGLVDWIGWYGVFSVLSIGPLLGIYAMSKLKSIEHAHSS